MNIFEEIIQNQSSENLLTTRTDDRTKKMIAKKLMKIFSSPRMEELDHEWRADIRLEELSKEIQNVYPIDFQM